MVAVGHFHNCIWAQDFHSATATGKVRTASTHILSCYKQAEQLQLCSQRAAVLSETGLLCVAPEALAEILPELAVCYKWTGLIKQCMSVLREDLPLCPFLGSVLLISNLVL